MADKIAVLIPLQMELTRLPEKKGQLSVMSISREKET